MHDYWPQAEWCVSRYGPIVIQTEAIIHAPGHRRFIFNVRRIDRPNEKTRKINMIHFTAWPDAGVPEKIQDVLDLCQNVHRIQSEGVAAGLVRVEGTMSKMGPPILVHCSAGIGRSAAMVAVDICLQGILLCGKVDVRATVAKLRQQRHNAIQTAGQYIFLYLTVLKIIAMNQLVDLSALNFDKFWAKDPEVPPK